MYTKYMGEGRFRLSCTGMDERKEPKRLFIKIERKYLPQIKTRYPFIYLERGRLEIDDSSVKWINSDGEVIRLPIATINCVLLGPGTSITHEAVKVMSSSNCTICWVAEDSLNFYAVGKSPTSDTRGLKKQLELATDKGKRLKTARMIFQKRYPHDDFSDSSLQEMMGMEGGRIKRVYVEYAEKYGVGWKGRRYTPGDFTIGDTTNRILTGCNHALYGIVTSVVYSMGYSPHVGFIHSGSPLPLVYDLADLYKEKLCIDLAFYLTLKLGGEYNRYSVMEEFRTRVIQYDILKRVVEDISDLMR